MRYRLAEQQPPVPCQQDTFFACGDVYYFAIPQTIAVNRVKTEQAQAARQVAEININNERNNAQWPGSQVLHRRDIKALEHGVHRDTITIFQSIIEAHGFVVHQDQVDFTMRYSENFNGVLDRGLSAKPIGNGLLVMFAFDEIIEFLVETKIGQMGFQVYNLSQQ